MKVISILFSAGLALTLAGCNQTPPDTHDADVNAIDGTAAQLSQAIAAKDYDKVATFFTDDAVLVGYATPPQVGKDTIKGWLNKVLADPGSSLKTQSTNTDVSKDMGYVWGPYQLVIANVPLAPSHVMNDHGTYIDVYRKQADGSWKVVRVVGTSEVDHAQAVIDAMSHHGGAK